MVVLRGWSSLSSEASKILFLYGLEWWHNDWHNFSAVCFDSFLFTNTWDENKWSSIVSQDKWTFMPIVWEFLESTIIYFKEIPVIGNCRTKNGKIRLSTKEKKMTRCKSYNNARSVKWNLENLLWSNHLFQSKQS